MAWHPHGTGPRASHRDFRRLSSNLTGEVFAADGDDSRLLALERRRIRLFSTYEHTRDAACRAEALAALRRVERDMARTPADTTRGLAVKFRCCLGHEEQEVDLRPWTPLLRRLLSDLET